MRKNNKSENSKNSNYSLLVKKWDSFLYKINESLGFQLLNYRIGETQFDKETLDRIAKITDVQAEVKAAEIACINYTQHQKLQALRDVANNQGASGMILGINMGNESSNLINNQNDAQYNAVAKLKKIKELFEADLISEEYIEKKKIF